MLEVAWNSKTNASMSMPFMMILSLVTIEMDMMTWIFLGGYVFVDLIIIQVVKVLIELLYFDLAIVIHNLFGIAWLLGLQ